MITTSLRERLQRDHNRRPDASIFSGLQVGVRRQMSNEIEEVVYARPIRTQGLSKPTPPAHEQSKTQSQIEMWDPKEYNPIEIPARAYYRLSKAGSRESLTTSQNSLSAVSTMSANYSTCSVSHDGKALYSEDKECPRVAVVGAGDTGSWADRRRKWYAGSGGPAKILQEPYSAGPGVNGGQRQGQGLPSVKVSRHASYTAGCASKRDGDSRNGRQPLSIVQRRGTYSPATLSEFRRQSRGVYQQPGRQQPKTVPADYSNSQQDQRSGGSVGVCGEERGGANMGMSSSSSFHAVISPHNIRALGAVEVKECNGSVGQLSVPGAQRVLSAGATVGGTVGGAPPAGVSPAALIPLSAIGERKQAGSVELEPVYEDIPDFNMHVSAPPKLTPLSGYLSKSGSEKAAVIRPIAFKPVTPTRSNPLLISPGHITDIKTNHLGPSPPVAGGPAADEGYVSRDTSRSCSHNPYAQPYSGVGSGGDSAAGSGDGRVVFGVGRAATNGVMRPSPSPQPTAPPVPPGPGLMDRSLMGRRGVRPESYGHPASISSPNGSVISMEEAEEERRRERENERLREKDVEIAHLRQTLEHNERVIFAVGEERQRDWQRQMGEMAEEYGRRLRSQESRAMDDLNSVRGELERERVRGDGLAARLTQFERECDRLRKAELQVQQYRAKCEDLEGKLSGKHTESASLIARAEAAEAQVTEIDSLRSQLANVERKLKESDLKESMKEMRDVTIKESHVTSLSPVLIKDVDNNNKYERTEKILSALEEEVESLRSEVIRLTLSEQADKLEFERERKVWRDEKAKVLQYQHQLQLNYVQMYRRNAQLEAGAGVTPPGATLSLPSPKVHVRVRLDEATTESLC